jgi:hypothetical protein
VTREHALDLARCVYGGLTLQLLDMPIADELGSLEPLLFLEM